MDDDGWLEALERIYQHREEAAAMARVARRTMERKFSQDVVAHQWLDTLLRLKDKPVLRLTEVAGVTPILGGMSRYES